MEVSRYDEKISTDCSTTLSGFFCLTFTLETIKLT